MAVDKRLDPGRSDAGALAETEVSNVIVRPHEQLVAAAPEYYWGKVIHEKLVLLRFGSTAHRFIRDRSGSSRSC